MGSVKPKSENYGQSKDLKVTPHPSKPSDQGPYEKDPETGTGTGSTFQTVPDYKHGQVEVDRVVIPNKVPKGF